MIKQILHISKNFFALLGILSLIGVSTLSVLTLNPKIVTKPSEVLGLSTKNENNIKLPFNIIDTNTNNTIITNLVNNQTLHQYNSSFSSAINKQYTYDFVKIINNNQSDIKVNIFTNIEGGIDKELKISMLDNIDEVILYSTNFKNLSRKITIPKLSSRTFKIKYEFTNQINFPFNIMYTFE